MPRPVRVKVECKACGHKQPVAVTGANLDAGIPCEGCGAELCTGRELLSATVEPVAAMLGKGLCARLENLRSRNKTRESGIG